MTIGRPVPALLPSSERSDLETSSGRVAYYAGIPEQPTTEAPVLLIHSVNAAAGAHEVRPLFEYFRSRRPTYALDLPGFANSERVSMLYKPRLMTDAVLAIAREVRGRHEHGPIDAVGVSLSSEFVARAASERPESFRSLALVSPTGLGRGAPFYGPSGSNRGVAGVWSVLRLPFVGAPLFRSLTSRASIRYFLRKTWGSANIDEQMFRAACLCARYPGARHAPLSFLSGYLFSADIGTVYESLSLPVWVAHGTRGDFTDFSWKAQIAARANWQVDVFETGALPYFEVPEQFFARYERFLHA